MHSFLFNPYEWRGHTNIFCVHFFYFFKGFCSNMDLEKKNSEIHTFSHFSEMYLIFTSEKYKIVPFPPIMANHIITIF